VDLDPNPGDVKSWIRIRIRNVDLDPNPGDVKSAKNEGGDGAKRQKIHHKMLT
jgi:hypothetical protein